MTKKQQREVRRAEKKAQGQAVRSAPDVRPALNSSPDLLADTIARILGPDERDDDIPVETRRELMQCATSNGRISYWYLCDIWRRGMLAERAPASDPTDWIDDVVRQVAELPDRTSPDDWPDAMLVTAAELRNILQTRSR